MTVAQLTPPTVTDFESFVSAVRESGVVGLGGAGFPTAVKLSADGKGTVDTIVLNGAECEPYITSDTRVMLDEMDAIVRGIEILKTYLSPNKKYIFGVEENKIACIRALKDAFSSDASVSVATLPSLYPQGAEKVLIYNTTRRVVPEGKLPVDVGVLVLNVSTLVAIAKYIDTGMPLVCRTVTVDGSPVSTPKNVVVPIGTPVSQVLGFVGVSGEIGKVLYGGPMMGIPLSSLDEPIIKTTGAITVMSPEEAMPPVATPCIHCGRCLSACPLSLNPVAYSKALNIESKEERMARLEATKVNLCMECGCCSYVCPAKRPLVQNNRLGKAALREYQLHAKTLK
jgi:electron transport complex protein RnfC